MAKITTTMELKGLEYFKSLYEQNIKLRKALKDCISDNCYYHEEECNMCTIGLLGQCKIPEAAKLLEECSINLSEKKEV